MKINTSDKAIAYLTLFSGLTISAVAVWYSVAGLVSIFAAAVIPIIVMGVALEVSKLIATVWLKLNWHRAPMFIKTYMTAAVIILMIITSMGIFGFLSKAHSDQSLVSGDVQSRIAVYDEKIKTAKENIEANRKALKQMDEAVDQVMGRSSDEKGAERAVQIRRNQAKERTRLQSEISSDQKTIATLNEEAAPIRAEVRKVEAEVGPLKYIAAFIYGDNPDANLLEKAVTWVIIIIVIVFDPLAVILLLASQYSFQWFRKQEEEEDIDHGEQHLEEMADILNEVFKDDLAKATIINGVPVVNKEVDLNEINLQLAEAREIPEPNVPTYNVVSDANDKLDTRAKDTNTLPQDPVEWNKMIKEAEKAAEIDRSMFPTNPFQGEQFRLDTKDGVKNYIYNGEEWVYSPVSNHALNTEQSNNIKLHETGTDNPIDFPTDESKKKTTYITKENNQQVKKELE
jgi:hypothetical protein